MKIQSVFDVAFHPYGKVIEGLNTKPLLETLKKATEMPPDSVIYMPGDSVLESLDVGAQIRDSFYGGMPIQIGYCNGSNRMLNCLEYHRDSELVIAADDVVLLLAPLQKVKDGKLDTSEVEAFLAPAGTAVQLYETTLHYAPCNAPGKDGFRAIVVLPRGTNTNVPKIQPSCLEDKMLWACNKWLIAHPDSNEAANGAFVGLTGENIVVK